MEKSKILAATIIYGFILLIILAVSLYAYTNNNNNNDLDGRGEKVMRAFSAAGQMIGGGIIALGYTLQIIKLLITKQSDDISFKQVFLIHLACVFFEVYAIVNRHAVAEFLITNSACLLLSAVELMLVIYYRIARKSKSTDII